MLWFGNEAFGDLWFPRRAPIVSEFSRDLILSCLFRLFSCYFLVFRQMVLEEITIEIFEVNANDLRIESIVSNFVFADRFLTTEHTTKWQLHTNYSHFLKIVSVSMLFLKDKALNWKTKETRKTKKNGLFPLALLVFGYCSSNQTGCKCCS